MAAEPTQLPYAPARMAMLVSDCKEAREVVRKHVCNLTLAILIVFANEWT